MVLTSVWKGGFYFSGGEGCVPAPSLGSLQGGVGRRVMQGLSESGWTLLRCPESAPSSALWQPGQELNLASPSLQVRKLIKIIRFSLLFWSWQAHFFSAACCALCAYVLHFDETLEEPFGSRCSYQIFCAWGTYPTAETYIRCLLKRMARGAAPSSWLLVSE